MAKYNSFHQLNQLQQVCIKQNIPFVSYRLPLSIEIATLIQQHSMPEKLDSWSNMDARQGFIVAPFSESDGDGSFFLQPDSYFTSNNIDAHSIKELTENNQFIGLKKPQNTAQTTSKWDFINNINKAIDTLKNGKLQKVVFSKVRVEKLPSDFCPGTFFLNLCEKYPLAMVYILQLPEVGCWIGATPEPLLVIENDKVKTVSLAGTQIATGKDILDYEWNPKEFEEQKIVTDFVEQTLQSLKIEKIRKNGPMNSQAANLIHLKTTFEFSKKELNGRLGDFLKALHPTPSVGGLPKIEARDYILENEKHDRSYYSGFLGPIGINNKTSIFVNLRCLQLLEKQFVLYSGAGITASSIAEREWEETDNKMMTLMNVMNL